jgi:hypothetical protein
MSDHLPRLDRFGDPERTPDDGTLLFDPNATPAPGPELPGYEEEERTHGRSPVTMAGVGMAVIVMLAGAWFVSRPDGDPATSADASSTADDVLVATGVDRLVPMPGVQVSGPLGSRLTVGVRALDGRDAPIADTLVRFSVASGGGVLEFIEMRTDGDGVAATALTLPTRPGRTVVRASAPDTDIESAEILADAVAGTPTAVNIVSGNGQQAETGELLENRLFVVLRDEQGRPVPNAEVRFRVDSGEGVTAPTRTRTDSLGRASALWRLGMVEGPQRLTAISSDLLTSVTFTATALPRVTLDADDGEPDETAPVTVRRAATAVGVSHVCSLASGSLACRGGNDRGQTGGRGADRFLAIAAGGSHTCGLEMSGAASCWGGNDRGQLGDGTRSDRPAPTRVRTELRFSMLAAGANHTCGLAGAGVPVCWGQNLSGQLGDGSRNDQIVPQTVGSGISFVTLAAGWNHTCGITENGNVFCWGQNNLGQLGDGSQVDRLVPTLVRGSVETLAGGSSHTCGISEGRVLCWGENRFGQLGDGTTTDRAQPAPVTGLPARPTHLAAGAVHSCALVEGGRAFCWGQNLFGQLGDGSTDTRNSAVPVSGGLTFSDIRAGGAQTCGTTTAGAEYCWGQNLQGQLGDGSRVNRSAPTRVTG